jgi:hypothetical protein
MSEQRHQYGVRAALFFAPTQTQRALCSAVKKRYVCFD